MSTLELASEIVKSAIENKAICLQDYAFNDKNSAEEQNAFNAKQISDFYQTIFKAIESSID